MARLASGRAHAKVFSGPAQLALLSVFFTGCANSCFFGFWNPPNGTIGGVISNPPPTCKLATPKGAIGAVMRVNRPCESCSESNRVQTVVLSLSGIDLHSDTNAAGESSSWQPLFPETGKRPRQLHLVSEKMTALSSESSKKLLMPAGSYDLVRLRIAQHLVRSGDEPLLENACGQAGPNCVIMADGHITPLVFEADTLEFPLTSEATVAGLPFVMPGSQNELLIELEPVLSMLPILGEVTQSFVILPGRARMEPLEKATTPGI